MSMTVSEIALKTIGEIERRGLAKGTFADISGLPLEERFEGYNPADYDDEGFKSGVDFFHYTDLPFADDVYEKCKVCTMGAAGAAFYGHPLRAPDNDGNGYDTFVSTLADAIDPDWRDATAGENIFGEPISKYSYPSQVIYTWNDARERTQEDVIATLREVAEKHANVPGESK